MERVTPINPDAQSDKAFEAAVKVLAASILDSRKKVHPAAKPRDVYPPEPNDVYPPEPNKPCKLIEEISHTAHVSHHAARVAIGHAARAFHATSIAVLVAKCPGNPD